MSRFAACMAVAVCVATPVLADFQPIREEASFRALTEGRDLVRFGVRVQVLPQGEISGRGFGMRVGGDWEWRDGYFCRTLTFGQSGDPYNCQLVLQNGDTLRFISDQGRGQQADLRLR